MWKVRDDQLLRWAPWVRGSTNTLSITDLGALHFEFAALRAVQYNGPLRCSFEAKAVGKLHSVCPILCNLALSLPCLP